MFRGDGVNTEVSKRGASGYHSFQAVSSKCLNESAEGAVAKEVVRADAPKARYLSPKSARFPFRTKTY